MKKTLYEKPFTELLVIRFEDDFLKLSSEGNTINNATMDTWEDEL